MPFQSLSLGDTWQSPNGDITAEYNSVTVRGGGAYGNGYAEFTEDEIEVVQVGIQVGGEEVLLTESLLSADRSVMRDKLQKIFAMAERAIREDRLS